MGKIIDGKLLAKAYREEISNFVENLKSEGKRPPCLTTILVGDDGGSTYYVKNQNKLCNEVGITANNITLASSTTTEKLLEIINRLNNSTEVDAIMLQVPLPKHIDEKLVTSCIAAAKDVDSLTDLNLGKFYKGEKSFIPCTPLSCIELIKSTGIDIQGKHAVVIGRSNIVGKPAAQLLLNENATVTICHSRTKNIKELCKSADILVAAIGKPHFVDESFIGEGSIVIDVGTTMVEGKVTGDVSFERAMEIASYVTPVPGGVGSMTTTMLLRNTCEAYKQNVR